jgi:hypothetical protein
MCRNNIVDGSYYLNPISTWRPTGAHARQDTACPPASPEHDIGTGSLVIPSHTITLVDSSLDAIKTLPNGETVSDEARGDGREAHRMHQAWSMVRRPLNRRLQIKTPSAVATYRVSLRGPHIIADMELSCAG